MGDIKANRVVVPPFKVSDVPYTDSDYRVYKMQFQAPPNVRSYTWRVLWSAIRMLEKILIRILPCASL